MSLSNDYLLSYTLNDVVTEAFRVLQVAGDGETLDGDMLSRAKSALNMMIKAWEGQGIHLWTLQEGTLFLVSGQAKYDFGSARLANSPVRTTTTAAEDAVVTPTVVSCTSVTGMTVGDNFGVLKDDNTIFWSSIASIATLDVTMNDAIDGAAASGNTVWSYPSGHAVIITSAADDSAVTFVVNGTGITGDLVTESIVGANIGAVVTSQKYRTVTQIRTIGNAGSVQVGISSDTDGVCLAQNPAADADLTLNGTYVSAGVATLPGGNAFVPVARVLEVRREDGLNSETPMVFRSREEYFGLPNKSSTGTPLFAYYSRQEPSGIMYLWNAPVNERPVINFTYERKIQVLNSGADGFDFPEYWFEALVYNLARRLLTQYGTTPGLAAEVKGLAMESLNGALAFDNANYPVVMKMDRYG